MSSKFGELSAVDSSPLGLTQEDLEEALFEHRGPPLLFGRVAGPQILEDFAERGIDARLLQRGYDRLEARIDRPSPFEESLQIFGAHEKAPAPVCLMVLKAHWGTLKLPLGDFKALVWDWLELMDPMAEFSPARPPLPGQTSPGLSMFRPLAELMLGYVERTEAGALVAVPRNFHNAVLYARGPGLRLRFLDPFRHGQLLAQIRDLVEGGPGRLGVASWAFEEGRIEHQAPDHAGLEDPPWEAWPWTPAELVLGLHDEIRNWLGSDTADIWRGEAHRFRVRPIEI